MIECFLVHPSGRGYVELRRYSRTHCEGPKGYHDSIFRTGDLVPVTRDTDGHPVVTPAIMYDGHDRWPKQCHECDYLFDQEFPRANGVDNEYDCWNVSIIELWNSRDGRQWLFEALPVGAMFDAFWTGWRGEDGTSLAVMLPGGQTWHVDGPAADGNRPWTRTGVAPVITVSPAVTVDGWQGYLQDGMLADAEEWAKIQHPAGKG